MDNISRLLAEASAGTPSVSDTKKLNVLQATEQKKVDLGGKIPTEQSFYNNSVGAAKNVGNAGLSPVETDVRNSSPEELIAKYGADGYALIAGRAKADANRISDETIGRNFSQAAADSVSSAGMGVANGILGIGALAAGAVNNDAAAWTVNKIDQLNDFGQSTQSPAMQAQRRLYAAQNTEMGRDTAAEAKANEAAGDNSFMVGSKKVGTDIVNTVKNLVENPMVAGDVVSQGIGSLATSAPVGNIIRKGAEKALEKKLITGKAGQYLAGDGATTAAIGLTEGAGGYQQGSSEVLKMTHDDLMKNSPSYKEELEKLGDTPENRTKVKNALANTAGGISAALTAPAALLFGSTVAKFEGHPTAVTGGLKSVLANMGKEAVEEAGTGGVGQLASNYAQTQTANVNKELTDGIGEQIVQGAVGGIGAAGAFQGPGAALQSAMDVGSKAASVVGDAVAKSAAKVQEENKASAPQADAKMVDAANVAATQAAQASADLDITPEPTKQDQVVKTHFDNVASALNYDGVAESANLPDSELKTALSGSVNAVDALEKATKILTTDALSTGERMAAAQQIEALVGRINKGTAIDESLWQELGDDHPLVQQIQGLDSEIARITSSPLVQESFQKISAAVNQAVENNEIQPITDTDTNVEQKVADGVMAVKYADQEKIDPTLPQNILFHAKKNNIVLPTETVNILNAADAAIQAREKYYANAQQSNLTADQVGEEIEIAGGEKGESFADHFNNVKAAMAQGNPLEAQGMMDDFAMFVQHMGNKVQAVNDHYEAGNSKAPGRNYQALNSKNRQWFNSAETADANKSSGWQVVPHNWDSVKQAQRIGREAQFGADLYNALSDAFPELQAGKATVPTLPTSLQGDVKQVAAAHTNKTRVGKQSTNAYARSASVISGSLRAESLLGTDAEGKNPIPDTAKAVQVGKHTLYVAEDGNAVWDVKGKQLQSANWVNAAKEAAGFNQSTPEVETPQKQEVPEKEVVQNKSENNQTKEAPKKQVKTAPEVVEESTYQVSDDQPSKADMEALREQLNEAQDNLAESKEQMADAQAKLDKLSTKPIAPEEPKKAIFTARKAPVRKITDTAKAQEKIRLEAENALDPNLDIDSKIDNAYDLLGERNGDIEPWFSIAYRAPKQAISYLFGKSENVFKTVTDALDNAGTMLKLRNDSEMKKNYSTDQKVTVANFIDTYGPAIETAVNNYKDEFLSRKEGKTKQGKPNPNEGRTFLETLKSGEDLAQQYSGAKSLALLDSNYNFNSGLIQAGVLAGLNYLIGGNKKTPLIDEESASAIFGLPTNSGVLVPSSVIDELKNTVDEDALVRDIAQEITRFWGVKTNNHIPLNYSEGIPQSLAANIVRAMVENTNLVKKTPVYLPVIRDGKPMNAEANRYYFDEPAINKALNDQKGLSDLLDHVVLTDPEDTYHFDGDKVPSRNTQVHSNTPITPEQKKVQELEKRNPFKTNMPMLGVYKILGTDSLVRLIGGGELVGDRALNKQHARSLEGKNMAVRAALDQLDDMLAVAQQYADETGKAFEDVEHFFEYAFTSVNRMHMQGRYNAQSNKAIREIIMPNESVIDLTDPTTKYNWIKSLSQALGIKVHNNLNVANEADFAKAVEKFKPVLDLMENFGITDSDYNMDSLNLENTDDEFGRELAHAIESTFGIGKATAAGIHALLDYGRSLRTDNKKAFRTMAYLEADGVTNGAANSMAMFTSGTFNSNWIANMRKVGLFFKPSTMNEYRTNEDKVDLYETSADNTKNSLVGEYKNTTGKVKESFQNVLSVLDHLSNDISVSQTENGSLSITMKRGFMKNPLTVTLYGSGKDGISAKIVREMIADAIYARASNIAALDANMRMNNPQAGIAFFSDLNISDADKVAKYKNLVNSLTGLTEIEMRRKQGNLFTKAASAPINWSSTATDFEIGSATQALLTKNVTQLVTQHIDSGIRATVGNDLMNSLEYVKVAVNAQSILMERLFKSEVTKALEEKRANPLWGKSDFLSKDEMTAIKQKLEKFHPMISSTRQNFDISGGEKSVIKGLSFGRDFTESIRVGALFDAPGAAGVKAIPFLNIGMGDGLMMQILSTMPEIKGTLKIFDGMHMPIDKIAEYGEAANKAVIETWLKNNPVEAVHKAFTKFTEELNDSLDITDEDWGDIYVASLTSAEKMFEVKDEKGKIIPPAKNIIIDRLKNALPTELGSLRKGIDARHTALSQINFFVDQMAASQAPANNAGKIDLSQANDTEIVNKLNELYKDALGKTKPEATEVAPTSNKEFAEAAKRTKGKEEITLPNGDVATLGTMNPAAVKRFLGKLKGTPEQQVMLREVSRLIEAQGISVMFGSKDAIQAKLGDAAPSRLNEEGTTVSGWFDPASKTVYLLNAGVEPMLHELIHATTFNAVLSHYNNKNSDPIVNNSIVALEEMMQEFMNMEDSFTDVEQAKAYADAKNEILNQQENTEVSEPVRKAAALNEFMAWSLANRSIASKLKSTSLPQKVAALAEKAFQAIRKILWPRISDKNVPKPMDDFLSNLQFHTGVVMRSQSNFVSDFKGTNLFMARKFGGSALAEKTAEAMTSKLVEFLQPEAIAESMRVDPQATARDAQRIRAQMNAVTLTNTAVASGFQLNPLESKVFSDMVTVLSTSADIDPIFMAQSQVLYDHAIKSISREDFMVNPMGMDPNDMAQAQAKHDLISGKTGVLQDANGRSSILPTFIALSMSSPEFNQVLSKIKTPKSVKNSAGTLDAALENIGNAGMEKLGEIASGQGMGKKDVASAMNAMANDLVKNHQNAANILVQAGDLMGTKVDAANAFIVKNMQKGADGLMRAANRTNNKMMKGAATFVASAMSDTHASNTAEMLNEAMNRTNGFHALRALLGDVIGRLNSNAGVYDMVKTVRSMVQQTRQQYKEELPKTLRSKFNQELSKKQWNSLHHGLGKLDVVSLIGSLGNAGIKEVFNSQPKLIAEIAATEKAIQSAYPSNWLVLEAKSKQLAEFMNTGKTGNNLLRNATAIASMLGENGFVKGSTPNADLVSAIDKLVSLYAIRDMSADQKQDIRDLYASEETGINYLIGSLKAQRQFETDKVAGNDVARLNGYKGYVPYTQAENTSVIVASSAEHAQLMERGYKFVAPYHGSNIDQDAAGLSYYIADHPTNSSFNQGIAQNVRLSSNGVDLVSGRSNNLHGAGRISNRALIGRVKQQARRVTGDFRLMPVYNADGEVVSLERSLDPAIITQSKPFQDLASSIGIWRGRQMEESMANEVNHTLIDKLNTMYKEDLANGTNSDGYVNILDPKTTKNDAVLLDAINLLSNDIKTYAQGVFGQGKFMIRRDMLKETLGYREASLGDAFTGNTRWSKESTERMRSIAQSVFGNDAYNKLTTFERNWQGLMHDARILIVVKSMIVPVANMVANVLQLKGRGVSWTVIANGIPRKLKETEFYVQTQIEKIRLQADLAAETAPNQQTKIKARLQTIDDAHKRLSIWPLIQAGEFSAVSDVGVVSEEDVDLVGGKLHQYVDNLVKKLPDGIRTVGRYAVISEDTALFRGLQKSVQYGDFLAKAILFDDMMIRQKLTKEEALAKITEEFVNYDILPGRDRGYLEKMGLMWFYNFKLRAAKIGMNMLRNNPLHSLIAMHVPAPDGLGAGLPISDSITGKLMNGAFTYSLGPGMGLRAPTLLPWINAVD